MTISGRQLHARRIASVAGVVVMLGGALIWQPPAKAQQAGGSQAGVGVPIVNTALYTGKSRPLDAPQCIHRTTDERPSRDPDDKRLTVWLAVRELTTATINASGSANGEETGTLAITLMLDGVPIAHSPETRGVDSILAATSAKIPLVPGRQYKIVAKPIAHYKSLGLFRMDVGVGKTCP